MGDDMAQEPLQVLVSHEEPRWLARVPQLDHIRVSAEDIDELRARTRAAVAAALGPGADAGGLLLSWHVLPRDGSVSDEQAKAAFEDFVTSLNEE